MKDEDFGGCAFRSSGIPRGTVEEKDLPEKKRAPREISLGLMFILAFGLMGIIFLLGGGELPSSSEVGDGWDEWSNNQGDDDPDPDPPPDDETKRPRNPGGAFCVVLLVIGVAGLFYFEDDIIRRGKRL